MNTPLDESWERVLPMLPARLRGVARSLPRHLNVSSSAQGGWGAFVHLEPVANLPAFGAECLGRSGPHRLESYAFAHCCGGFWGLLQDRVADGEAASGAPYFALGDALEDIWRESLYSAGAERPWVRLAVARAKRSFDRGIRRERAAWRRHLGGQLPPWSFEGYSRSCLARVQWFSLATHAMLRAQVSEAHARSFDRVVQLLMLSLQCLDDAGDEAEDRQHKQAAVTDVLRVRKGTLIAASELFARRAEEAARVAGFLRLGNWTGDRADEVRSTRMTESEPLLDAVGAMAFVAAAGAL